MQAIKKAVDEKNYTPIAASNRVKSYTNEPFFVKKAEEARQTISKIGLPGAKKK